MMSSFMRTLSLITVAWMGCGHPMDAQEVRQRQQHIKESDCPPMPHTAGPGTDLTPAPDQQMWFVLEGVGTQNYTCNAAGAAWTFSGPVAELLKENGKDIGTHYASAAGPTRPAWQFRDGSVVIGARVAGISVSPSSVPWLLLTAVDHQGEGRFTDVTSIQRLGTVDGVAPPLPCAPGAVARVPYRTDYFFYRLRAPESGQQNRQCRSLP